MSSHRFRHSGTGGPGPFGSRRGAIGFFAGLALFVAALVVPPPAGAPESAWHMLGIALLMACWWIGESIPIAGTALLPLVLYPALGILPSRVVAKEYGNHLIFLFLGGFMIAIAMERWGLHRRIALAIVARTGNSPQRLILGFMLAVAFLSMWISNTATALMILPIAMAVVEQLSRGARWRGEDDGPGPRARGAGDIWAAGSDSSFAVESTDVKAAAYDSLGGALMLAVAYSASAGGMATLIGTPPNIVLAGAAKELFPQLEEIAFGRWMLLGVPVAIAALALVYAIVPRLGATTPLDRFDFGGGGGAVVQEKLRALGSMGPGERGVLICFLAAVALWLSRSDLRVGELVVPGWARLFPEPAYLHDATVAIAAGIALMIVRVRAMPPAASGSPACSVESRASAGETLESSGPSLAPPATSSASRAALLDWSSVARRTPWGILLLFGGGFALAAGFAESGLAAWIGSGLAGSKGLPTPLLILTICLATTFLTEVTSNTATSTMLMPVLGATAVAIGEAPLLLMVPAALSASCAFMLPVATPPNAIVFGSGWVTIPRMAKVGLVLNLGCAVVITLLCWLLVPRVLPS